MTDAVNIAFVSAAGLGAVDPLLVWIAAACIATLLAQAAVAKWADLALLEQHLAAYGLPAAALRVGALALPMAEGTVALLLLTPLRGLGALLAACLLAAYAALMAWHRWRGHELDCGCGGEPLPLSWALVLRNLGLALLAVVAAAPLATREMGLADFFVVAAALLLGSLLYAALNQLLRHRGGMASRNTLWRRS